MTEDRWNELAANAFDKAFMGTENLSDPTPACWPKLKAVFTALVTEIDDITEIYNKENGNNAGTN